MPKWLAGIPRWGLLTVLALLVLALLVLTVLAAEMVSWNFLKEPVEERFEATNGSVVANAELASNSQALAATFELTADNSSDLRPWCSAHS